MGCVVCFEAWCHECAKGLLAAALHPAFALHLPRCFHLTSVVHRDLVFFGVDAAKRAIPTASCSRGAQDSHNAYTSWPDPLDLRAPKIAIAIAVFFSVANVPVASQTWWGR